MISVESRPTLRRLYFQGEYGGQHHESGHCPNAAIGMDHPLSSREHGRDRLHRVDHSDDHAECDVLNSGQSL